jgi:hypothetical protein
MRGGFSSLRLKFFLSALREPNLSFTQRRKEKSKDAKEERNSKLNLTEGRILKDEYSNACN